MCIAAPMKLTKIHEGGRFGTAFLNGNELEINLSLLPGELKIGDYVLVHAGCALEIVKRDFAEEILEIFKEIGESADGF